jgi:hypothetical protein
MIHSMLQKKRKFAAGIFEIRNFCKQMPILVGNCRFLPENVDFCLKMPILVGKYRIYRCNPKFVASKTFNTHILFPNPQQLQKY